VFWIQGVYRKKVHCIFYLQFPFYAYFRTLTFRLVSVVSYRYQHYLSQINKLVLYALLKITFPVAHYLVKRSVSYVEIDRKMKMWTKFVSTVQVRRKLPLKKSKCNHNDIVLITGLRLVIINRALFHI
jgi:hypothetical protein